jgi:hypothetical protein
MFMPRHLRGSVHRWAFQWFPTEFILSCMSDALEGVNRLLAKATAIIENRQALILADAINVYDELIEREAAAKAAGLTDLSCRLRSTAEKLWHVMLGEV